MYVEKKYNDSLDDSRVTKLIHFTNSNSVDKAAMLSRYSRSQKSMTDLIDTEFKNLNRAPSFISKLLNEYGDDSIAELGSETIGVEGLSILAASKLTDQRIGISFLEKSTRYVPFTPESFYIPIEMYDMGLVDEYLDVCGLSYNCFDTIQRTLSNILPDRYPIDSFRFKDTKKGIDSLFSSLKDSKDIEIAKKAYDQSIKAKIYDIAGYAWLCSLKTNLGFHANARALEHLLKRTRISPITELNNLSYNLRDLLSKSIEPFLGRVDPEHVTSLEQIEHVKTNPYDIYNYEDRPSITSLYKSNIVERFNNSMDIEDAEEEELLLKHQKKLDQNENIVKHILGEIGFSKNVKLAGNNKTTSSFSSLNSLDFEPVVSIVHFLHEPYVIDQLCTMMLFENNENLLEYDENNSFNISDNKRLLPIDRESIKSGILYNVMNEVVTGDDITGAPGRLPVNEMTENILSTIDIQDYWQTKVNNIFFYQNVDLDKMVLNKEQEFLIKKYVGQRKSRRDKLGKAFEFVDYTFEIDSSYRIMREWKRHRMASSLYPKVITARNSLDSFIIPQIIIQNNEMFTSYKNLMEKSFSLYKKIIEKSNDYHTAQYCLPLATKCKYVTKMNVRELDYIFGLRTTPQAHEEFRDIMHKLYSILRIIHPNVSKVFQFIDKEKYPLGRLHSEKRKHEKLNLLK